MRNIRKIISVSAVAGVIALAYQADYDQANYDAADVIVASVDSGASQQAVAESILSNAPSAGEKSSNIQRDTTYPELWSSDAVIMYAEAQAGHRLSEINRTDATDKDADKTRSPRAKMSGPLAAIVAAGGSGNVEIIVRYDQRPELFDDKLVAKLGGVVTRSYGTLDMRAISIPVAALEELAGDENIDWLSLDEDIFTSSVASRIAANVPADSASNAPWQGKGAGIAIIDTGSALHNDLDSSYLQYSFLQGSYPQPEIDDGEIDAYNDDPRTDGFGHGTHVAGILAGSGDDSNGDYKGSATKAHFLSLQALDANGSGSLSDVMAAIDWILEFGEYFDIRVVNLSIGKAVTESNETDPLVLAVESLWDAGYVVVVAAGNYGHYGNLTITSPANSRKVITVGSLTDNGSGNNYDDDSISAFSSVGPTLGDFVVKPDLVAPGDAVVAAIPATSFLGTVLPQGLQSCTYSGCNSMYLEMSGTSMAAPMVSAAVARMLEKDPTLTPATIKARLMRSARKIDSNFVSSGAGLLDVDAAMNETGTVAGDALSPLMYEESATGGYVIEDPAVLWGDSMWGSGFIWTDGFAWTNGVSWTDGDGVTSSGFAWTDGSGIDATGFGWTDGDSVKANGFGWTDAGVGASGFGWTDEN